MSRIDVSMRPSRCSSAATEALSCGCSDGIEPEAAASCDDDAVSMIACTLFLPWTGEAMKLPPRRRRDRPLCGKKWPQTSLTQVCMFVPAAPAPAPGVHPATPHRFYTYESATRHFAKRSSHPRFCLTDEMHNIRRVPESISRDASLCVPNAVEPAIDTRPPDTLERARRLGSGPLNIQAGHSTLLCPEDRPA